MNHIRIFFILLLCWPLVSAGDASPGPAPESSARAEEQARHLAEEQAARADQAAAMADQQAALAEQKASIAEAEASLSEALRAVEAVRRELEEKRDGQAEKASNMREELSRAHQQLREASREVARMHRELAMADRQMERVRLINLGDRAVIGVLLGSASEQGIALTGVSPDGPAERAGLRQGDVLVSIAGVDLAGLPHNESRDKLLAVMDEATAGEALEVGVLRDGDRLDFTVTPEKREPRSWQSLIRLPEPPPGAPDAPGAPRVMIETIEVPEIDEEALAIRIHELTDQFENLEYRFIGEDGKVIEFAPDVDLDVEALSRIGGHALDEANIWFGMPQTRGLELASINPGLGRYFKADSGVLVIEAREGNAYGLLSGDVIQTVGSTAVGSPADLLRALRDLEPGSEIELGIKRERKSRTLRAVVPENRLGSMDVLGSHRLHVVSEAGPGPDTGAAAPVD